MNEIIIGYILNLWRISLSDILMRYNLYHLKRNLLTLHYLRLIFLYSRNKKIKLWSSVFAMETKFVVEEAGVCQSQGSASSCLSWVSCVHFAKCHLFLIDGGECHSFSLVFSHCHPSPAGFTDRPFAVCPFIPQLLVEFKKCHFSLLSFMKSACQLVKFITKPSETCQQPLNSTHY